MTQDEVCFLCFPPAFAAVPQYFVHIKVVPLPLSEPDKRLSHTSGSSVGHSVCPRPAAWIQVFADANGRPARPGQCPVELLPGVCLALTLAVEPLEQDVRCVVDIGVAPIRVIRYGVVVQMSGHAVAG